MKWMIAIWILLRWSLYPMTSNLWAAQAERVEKELSEKKEEFERIKKRLRLKQKEKEDILRKESWIRKSLGNCVWVCKRSDSPDGCISNHHLP
jgi:hypothetical protein